nr:probable sugar phosphate/phosphate translocator At3g11320 [Tanacetum cinerariifolium]
MKGSTTGQWRTTGLVSSCLFFTFLHCHCLVQDCAFATDKAVGATTPFFTAVFAYVMTVKREAWLTYFTLLPVVTGVVIASG